MRPLEMVLASRNPHKVAELGVLLAPHRLVPVPADIELPPEDGSTFEQNALIKARAVARATGRPSVADDSGIVAAALNGAPGIRSARFAGEQATDEQNLAKLLAEIAGTENRRAAYVCALALVEPVVDREFEETLAEGRCEGRLVDVPRGGGGFGYDPAFVADEYAEVDLTMAEISQAQKDAISHRGAAAKALLELLARRS